MNYEQILKEALNNKSTPFEVQNWIKANFPKLKESEDERMRNGLIIYLRSILSNKKYGDKFIEDWIAWLKEQGEQKPAVWSDEDDTFFKAIIRDIENTKYISEDAKKDRITWLKSLKDRVQPQPKQVLDFLDKLRTLKDKVQPKQEWSYNDEIIIETIIQEIEKIPSEKFIDNAKNRCLDWLRYRTKSLRPQNNVTDEELAKAKKDAYNDALNKIEYHSGEPTFDDGWSAAIWYLKKRNAQPQSTWKPSDEQMKGIECAIKTLQYQLNIGDNRLNLLYDDLKKLREE